jgi:AraC-like DNA-binding protein
MHLFYKDTKIEFDIYCEKSSHISPHIHSELEMVYVTEGTLEIGVGQELYHMETGDFAIVFPDLIHHYQVFDSRECRAIYLQVPSSFAGTYLNTLQQNCPEQPVIKAADVHRDVSYAIRSLLQSREQEEVEDPVVRQAFVQIILAHSLPHYKLRDRSTLSSGDIIYETVVYIARHFMEEISLTGMAKELGYSPYALSRVFSGTFHTNFNQYLNDIRLDYACSLLDYTNQTVTEAYENAGFQSQRTFNRVFQDRYGISPREYRKRSKEQEPD